MYTTKEENGRLNNYAVEPPITYASYPAAGEQKRYLLFGAVAASLVTALVLISIAVS